MNRDIMNLIKEGTSTFLNIAQMTQYRVRYVQDRDEDDKEKMYRYALFAGVGIVSLLAIGIVGLIESRKDY